MNIDELRHIVEVRILQYTDLFFDFKDRLSDSEEGGAPIIYNNGYLIKSNSMFRHSRDTIFNPIDNHKLAQWLLNIVLYKEMNYNGNTFTTVSIIPEKHYSQDRKPKLAVQVSLTNGQDILSDFYNNCSLSYIDQMCILSRGKDIKDILHQLDEEVIKYAIQ